MKKEVDMVNGGLLKKIIFYVIPLMLTNVLQLFYNAADTLIVSRGGGADSVAAVGAPGTVINLLIGIFMGLSVGVSVCVGKAIGAGKKDGIENSIHTAFGLALIGSLIVMLIGYTAIKPLLVLMDTPENILPLSMLYINIYLIGVPANLIYNFMAAVLRAKGDTTRPFIFLSVAGAANVALNLVFVLVFKIDVAGVAIATVISQVISAILIVIYMCNSDDIYRLSLSKIKIHKLELKEILRMGLPSGFQGALFSLSTMVIQSGINSFGSSAIAGNTAGSNIDSFCYVLHNSFYYASTVFVAQNYGAKKYDRIKKSVLYCTICTVTVAITSGLLIYAFGKPLLSFYLPDSIEAVEFGYVRITVTCLLYFILSLMDVMAGSLRGLGSSIPPTVISLIGSCGLRVMWLFTVFKAFHTPTVLYFSYPVGWGSTFIALFVAYLIIMKSVKKECIR